MELSPFPVIVWEQLSVVGVGGWFKVRVWMEKPKYLGCTRTKDLPVCGSVSERREAHSAMKQADGRRIVKDMQSTGGEFMSVRQTDWLTRAPGPFHLNYEDDTEADIHGRQDEEEK